MKVKERELRLGKLCQKVNELSYNEFKRLVIDNLRWYGIPKTWRISDIEDFYNKHRHGKEAK